MAAAASPTLLLDTASLYYRSYFALPESMTAPDGSPHNAIRGLLTTITRLVERTGADRLACCWDTSWRPDWRVALLPSYKTHRLADAEDVLEAEPDTLGPQISAIADILDALGICRPGVRHYEADDVIASIAAQADGPIFVITGDRDLVQVVDDDRQVRVVFTANGGMEGWPVLDSEAVVQRFGVLPHQYVDLAVLRGDPSDGIPGVPGIGAKTAAALVSAFGGVEQILEQAASAPVMRPMTPRLAENLLAHADLIERSRRVATAVTDLPVPFESSLLEIPRTPADPAALTQLAKEWGVERYATLPSRTVRGQSDTA